ESAPRARRRSFEMSTLRAVPPFPSLSANTAHDMAESASGGKETKPMQQYSSKPRRMVGQRAIAAAVLFSVFAVPRTAAAQSQSGPSADLDDADPPVAAESVDRWAAAAEFSMTATSGNQEMTVLATGFTLRHLRRELFDFQL